MLRWLGHKERIEEDQFVKETMESDVRLRGKPQMDEWMV